MNDYRGSWTKKERIYLDRFNGFIFERLGDGSIRCKHFSWKDEQKICGRNIYVIKAAIERKIH